MSRDLAARIASLPRTHVEGLLYRHVKPEMHSLTGSLAGGRWGPPKSFPVLYLGRPPASVVIEAYRWLVDIVEGMRPELVGPRDFLTCKVDISQVLDLRTEEAQRQLGLTHEILHSAADDPGAYRECQGVARVAHQLEMRGILAPAAEGAGYETLAVFTRNMPLTEMPTLVKVDRWAQLPPDPRVLQVIEGGRQTS